MVLLYYIKFSVYIQYNYHLIATQVTRSLCLHLQPFFIYLIISGDSSFTVSKVMNFQKIEKTPDYCDQMPLLK